MACGTKARGYGAIRFFVFAEEMGGGGGEGHILKALLGGSGWRAGWWWWEGKGKGMFHGVSFWKDLRIP